MALFFSMGWGYHMVPRLVFGETRPMLPLSVSFMSRAKTSGEALLKISSFFVLVVPGFAQLAPNRYTLLLEDPPVAERFARREEMLSAAGATFRAQIEAKQRTVMA